MSRRRSSVHCGAFVFCAAVMFASACGAETEAPAATARDGAVSTTQPPVTRPGRTVFDQPSLWPETVRIQMIGDSITAGPHIRGSLWVLLGERRCDADMVGTRRSFIDEVGDPDHDGYEGHTIAEIAALVPDVVPASRPDIVLLHAGTNDLAPGVDIDRAVGRLRSLVMIVVDQAPDAEVVIAEIVPLDGAIAEVEAFNAGVRTTVDELRAAGLSVTSADLFERLRLERHTNDGVHPNAWGGRVLAHRWADAIESVRGPCTTG